MKRSLLTLVFALAAPRFVFAAALQSTVINSPGVSLNGATCAGVKSWQGGDPRAQAVLENGPGTGKKHLGAVTYDPVSIEVSLPLTAPLATALADFCSNGSSRSTLVLSRYSLNGSVVSLQANNALLTAVKFPALDASGNDLAQLTFVFIPESVVPTSVAAPASTGPAPATRLLASNFNLSVSGLDATKVSRIEPFTIARVADTNAVGEFREYAKTPSAVVFPNLVMKLSVAGATTWTAWRDSFIVAGQCADSDEKSGSLSIATASQTPGFTLQFSHLGLVRLTSPAVMAGAETVAKFEAELYVESISIVAAAAVPTPSPTPKGEMAKGTPTPTPSRQETPTKLPKETKPTTTPTPVSQEEIALPPDKGTTSSATSPNDKGARDPANFNRADGLVRKSYDLNKYKDSTQETALYTTSTKSVENLARFYDEYLKSDGWEEYHRMENNNGLEHTHQLIVVSNKAKDSVTLTFTDVKPGIVECEVKLVRAVVR